MGMCRYCKSEIDVFAQICPYCRMETEWGPSQSSPRPTSSANSGGGSAILGAIVFAFLILFVVNLFTGGGWASRLWNSIHGYFDPVLKFASLIFGAFRGGSH